jgi:ABC-type nitrate/sulfonate/bicarbonate transport system permease component
MRGRRWGRPLRRWAPPTILLALLLACWEAWVRWRHTRVYVLPAPSRVAAAVWETRQLLWCHMVTTVDETALGVVVGAALGVALAVLVASSGLARRTVEPLLVATQTVPLIVLAPLLVLWFGFGMTPKVVVVVLIVFFPVAISTAAGLAAADDEQIDLVRSLGARRATELRLVRIPAALPAFFAGLRISSTYAVAGATLGELIGGRSGLGIYIARSQRAFRYDQIMAGVAVVTGLSIVLFGLIHVLARLTTPWQYAADAPARPDNPARGPTAAPPPASPAPPPAPAPAPRRDASSEPTLPPTRPPLAARDPEGSAV